MNFVINIAFCILIYLVKTIHFICTLVNLFAFYFEKL